MKTRAMTKSKTTKKVKITSRGKYAITVMVELAKQKENKPTPLSGIAERSEISLSYLEQLIAGLRRHDLVKSYRGPGGGYLLKKPANDIIVSDILIAAEDITPARRNKGKKSKDACETSLNLWTHIEEFLYAKLKNLSLSDVVNNDLD